MISLLGKERSTKHTRYARDDRKRPPTVRSPLLGDVKKALAHSRDLSPSLDRVRSKPTSREERSLEIFKNFCSFEKFPEARCVCACALFDRPTTTTTTRRKKDWRKKNTTTTHHVQQVHPHRHVPVASVVVEPGASQHQRHERHVRGVHRLQREPVGGALKVRIGD